MEIKPKKIKLIIQIPCYNEENVLPITLHDLPRTVSGVDAVEWLVIDDGSEDNTAEVAKANGVDHIVSHSKNCGLAKAFQTGVNACLNLGADIIVNTDADNQYRAEYIPALIQPILENKAEIVIGARNIKKVKSFSMIKRFLHALGSWTVRIASGTKIPDAPSGFRAFSKEAAQQMNVFNYYTYTLETIIQAGQKNIPIAWIPIETNAPTRPSKLIKSIPSYIKRSLITIIRMFVIYRPFRFFFSIGLFLLFFGLIVSIRFLYFYLTGEGGGHIQSLIFASIMIGMGFQTILIAFVADMISANRRLLEKIKYLMK